MGSASRPPRSADSLQGRRYAPFCDILDVSPSLEGQTTFKSNETKSIMTVSKRDSQQKSRRYDVGNSRKAPKTNGNGAKSYTNGAKQDPGAPHLGGSAMGGQPMADPHWKNARGSASRPP